MKNAASRAVVSGEKVIQSAQNMFDFCSEKMILSSDCPDHICSERTFQLLTTEDIAREPHETLEAVKGTQSIHSLFFDGDKTMARDMSCFCNTCLLGESGDCHNRDFVGDWKVVSGPTSSRKRKRPRNRQLAISKSQSISPPRKVPCASEIGAKTKQSRKRELATPDCQSNPCSSPSQLTTCIKVPWVAEGLGNLVPVRSVSSFSSVSRLSDFSSFQARLVKCDSFRELKSVVEAETSNLLKFCLPVVEPRRLVDVGIVDKVALGLMPSFLKPLFGCTVFDAIFP